MLIVSTPAALGDFFVLDDFYRAQPFTAPNYCPWPNLRMAMIEAHPNPSHRHRASSRLGVSQLSLEDDQNVDSAQQYGPIRVLLKELQYVAVMSQIFSTLFSTHPHLSSPLNSSQPLLNLFSTSSQPLLNLFSTSFQPLLNLVSTSSQPPSQPLLNNHMDIISDISYSYPSFYLDNTG